MEAGANIIMIHDSTRTPKNPIKEYGRITVGDIEANIQHFVGQQTRQAHNSLQLLHCLKNSMTESAHLNNVAESGKYTDNEMSVGELLLKLMLQKAVINTRSTATYIRENLTNLDTYMSTVNSDIDNFNQYVKMNMDRLKSRGERTDDLMINLFKAYQAASDDKLLSYIKTK